MKEIKQCMTLFDGFVYLVYLVHGTTGNIRIKGSVRR